MSDKIARFELNADRASLYCDRLPENRIAESNLGVRIPRQRIARLVVDDGGVGLYCDRSPEREVKENE